MQPAAGEVTLAHSEVLPPIIYALPVCKLIEFEALHAHADHDACVYVHQLPIPAKLHDACMFI